MLLGLTSISLLEVIWFNLWQLQEVTTSGQKRREHIRGLLFASFGLLFFRISPSSSNSLVLQKGKKQPIRSRREDDSNRGFCQGQVFLPVPFLKSRWRLLRLSRELQPPEDRRLGFSSQGCLRPPGTQRLRLLRWLGSGVFL